MKKFCGNVLALSSLLGAAAPVVAAETALPQVEAAIANVELLERPRQEALATVWDGNKYVQCRMLSDKSLRCEAAGMLMQPSLRGVLTTERLARLDALGWELDPSFGNYVQIFPPGVPTTEIADVITQVLAEAYGADTARLQVATDWIAKEKCPPRNGPTQNLAGMINDAPAMASTAVHACAYTARSMPRASPLVDSAPALIDRYGQRTAAEIQRLRVNAGREVFLVLGTGAGYVQCQPETSPLALYCEAQSAESWPDLASILTPAATTRLHAAGFADPGRAPNYWKSYPLDKNDDASIARELLTILYDVYGYRGFPTLEVASEKGP